LPHASDDPVVQVSFVGSSGLFGLLATRRDAARRGVTVGVVGSGGAITMDPNSDDANEARARLMAERARLEKVLHELEADYRDSSGTPSIGSTTAPMASTRGPARRSIQAAAGCCRRRTNVD
jgi:hypothetical protein